MVDEEIKCDVLHLQSRQRAEPSLIMLYVFMKEDGVVLFSTFIALAGVAADFESLCVAHSGFPYIFHHLSSF